MCIVILPFAYIMLVAFLAFRSGLTWSDMDFDNDGHTSFAEFIESADTGVRQAVIGDEVCTEYFSLKDALPVKLTCPRPIKNPADTARYYMMIRPK